MAYTHILLAADLNDASDKTTQKTMQLVKLFGAQLSVVHAIEPIAAYGYPELADLQSPLIDSAKDKMAALVKQLGIPEANAHLEFGPVKKIVPELASKLNVDLVILGSHEHHGIARLLGSSTNAIMHHTQCDTLIVHN